MTSTLKPDPSVIGAAAEAPFAVLPDPLSLFAARARRFDFLAGSSRLADYLRFLGALSAIQADVVAQMTPVEPLPQGRLAAARTAQMPPLDRAALAADPALADTLVRVCAAAAAIDMPPPARLALDAVAAATPDDRGWLIGNILDDHIPEDSAAPHLFAAAAVQVHAARLASTLDAGALVPVGTGICPACGGRPGVSLVTTRADIENVRYASCATCATEWNEVRVKCLCCGSGKGISYRSVETADATVKAEVCADCGSWFKILYQVRNPSLDPVADDVGSLGLDLMMRETEFRRAGFNPYLAGF